MPNRTSGDAAQLPPMRCPACGAPLDLGKLRPEQTTVVCDYCGTASPIPGAPSPWSTFLVTSAGKWVQGGWAGDPRVWGVFVLLVLGLVALLVFGDFGPR